MSSSSSHLSQQQQQHQHQQQQHLSPHKSSQVADSVVHSAEACLAKCEELAAKVASLNNAAPGPQTVVATNKMTINITNTNLSSTAPTATTMPIPRDQVAPSSCATESALSVPAHYHQSRPAQEIVVAFAPTNTTSRRPSNQAASNDSKYHSQQATTPSHQQKQLQHPQQQSTSSTGNVLAMVNPDTRTHVVGELYDTERSYVESLQILIEKYMKPLKSLDNKSLIESNLVDEIFYTIPEILDHHERFLNALQERLADDWDSSQVIGNVFIEAFTNQQIIDTYTKFINNWKNAKHAIKVAIQAKPAFERFLEAMSREHRNKLTLDALLIMPVQRIPRYELLIKELIKHTPHDHPDHGPLMEAQKEIHELALKIDRAEKEMIHQEQLKDLEALIEGHVELQHPQRDFIRYDLVTISASTLTVAKKERVLFLFCDLLIMTSVKKKVSRRSNLQAAFANSDHDISLLEGNKFKLILRVSLDQVDIKCDTHDQTQLWQQQQQHQQQYHEQQLVALAQRKKLIQGTKRELESDLFVLQQMEHLSNQLTRADKANLINNIGDSMEQIRIKLSNLEQQNSDCENYAEQQQQLSLQHSAQLAQDLYIIQTPVVQQNQGLQQPSNNSLSLSLSRDHHNSLQVQSSTPSGGSDQDHTSKQHTDASLEFIINNNLTASKEFLDANLNSSISLIGGVEAPLEQELSGSGLINSPTPESQHQQLTSGNTNCESLVVSFPSRDRRQAFIQAFLEAKQVRLMQRQYQQHQKMFSSSNIVRLSQLEHPLMKSRSMASDMRRNRLQHQDEVLDIRFSDPLGKHTDKRHEDRISSAPCATTIVHQMSVPLCIDTSYDKQLIATHCGVSRSSNCTLDSSDKCQHRQHNSHHHHQLMHQPASHPALLHTICCHESHNDAMDHHSTKSLSIKLDQQMTDRGGERASMEQNNYVRGVIDQRSRTMHTDNRDGHEDESIISLLQNDLDKCNQINDQILMLKFVPRFLTALPMNFLNTQHPALQLTCSISRKFNLDDKNNYCGVNENTIRELRDVSNRVRCQTVSDNQGQLWLCMSNGYVSHISLIEFVAGRIGSRCNHEHSCSEHYIRPVIKAGGDICKSQINCAAQVGWSQTVIHSKDSHSGDRSKRIKPVGQDMNSLIKSDEEREQHHLDPISTKVSVKPTSPPVNIERKSQFTNSTQAKKISSSAPSTHDDTRPGTHAAGLSLSINEIKLSNSKRKNDSAKIKHTPRQPSSDSSTDAHPANLRHQTLQHHHHSQDQLHRCRNTNRQPPPLCNNNNGRPGHRGVYQLTGAAGHQQHQHQHHTHSHHHGHHQHHHHHHHHHHHQHNHHSHQMYHQKHHTVPLAELRLALERQSKLSASDKDQLSLPGGSHRDGNRLAPPANTPSPIEAGSVDSVNAPCLANNPVQSRKARSTTPPARHLSTGNKSLRSARQLRHQASLKTSSILAKLVGSAGRGSFYLKRSSTTRAHSNSKPHSDAEDNDTDTDQQHGSAAKQDETNALKDSNQSITNPNLLTATNSNANVNNNSIVSPLSSVSSLNSTNSSITVNSVCASSPNHGGCALLGLPQWSSTTCCSARNQSNCSSEDRQELSSPGEDFSGSIENCNIRSRSATVPCRAYCEQSMPEKVSYDPYKVSEIIDDSYSEMRNYEEGSNSATTRTTTTKNPTSIDKQTSLWLGCDDGSLIIIDCLRPDNQSCNACDIGPGQNMHSELKLGASISDIKNHLDRIVFVALADGRLVVFSRKTEDNGTLGEWQLTNPQILTITENELSSTSRLCVINENHLWYSYGRNISVLNISSLSLETTIMTPTNDKSIQFAMQTISINSMESVAQLDGVWVSFRGSPLIQFYESRDYKLLLEFSALEPINRILSCGNEIIRQHKTACLGATSLLSIYNETEDSNSLFIGTTAGLILVLTISRSQLQEQVESQKLVWNPQVISLRHGHSSSVKFLHLIELMRSPNGQEADRIVDRNNNNDGNNATLDDTDSNESQHNITPHRDYACTSTTKTSSLCLVSGGAGIDLYGPDDNQQILQHLSTDDDCLNHLILWEM